MKENFTSINIILDRSGSMGHLRHDTIGSFNTFLQEQRAFPGEAVFTLRTFNEHLTTVCDFLPISNVAELTERTYSPSGSTALLDAVAQTIDDVGARLAFLPEDQRPSKVLVVVITDGQENASHRFTLADVKQRVEHQTSVYSWQFVFLGASLDQINDAVGLGVTAGSTLQYATNSAGIHSMYDTLSASTTSYRASPASFTPDFFATSQQQQAQQNVPSVSPTPTTAAPVTTTPNTGSGTDTTSTGSSGGCGTAGPGTANKPVNYRHSFRDQKSGRFSSR